MFTLPTDPDKSISGHSQPWILLIGSAVATEAMLVYAARAVEQATKKHYLILGTGRPDGVDHKIASTATWYGADLALLCPPSDLPRTEINPDELEILLDLCSLGLVIWDGADALGQVYERLMALGKEAHLINFRKVRRASDTPEVLTFTPPPPYPAPLPPGACKACQ